MKFLSTRAAAAAASLSTALIAGLAPDGGLYVPESLPRFSIADFADCDSLSAIATRLLTPFFAGDPLAEELPATCAEAFDFPVLLKPL
ncbi:MAG: threonine synthase, partial [Dokdonella sp.]